MGSANQLKVSRPMSSASWEHTVAKLHQPHKEPHSRSRTLAPLTPHPNPNLTPKPNPTPDPTP